MVLISIKEDYELHLNIDKETILKEHKEFFLRKSLTLDDISDIKRNYMNSKTQRYGVCNAMETLLISKDVEHSFLHNFNGRGGRI